MYKAGLLVRFYAALGFCGVCAISHRSRQFWLPVTV